MGNKTNPNLLRLGLNSTWITQGYVDRNVSVQNKYIYIREFIVKYFTSKSIDVFVGDIYIKLHQQNCIIFIPIYIEKKRHLYKVHKHKKVLLSMANNYITEFRCKIITIKISNIFHCPTILCKYVAYHLERNRPIRVIYRWILQRYEKEAPYLCCGFKVIASGRMGKFSKSSKQTVHRGVAPTSNYSRNLKHGVATALLANGIVGIQAWITFKE